MQTFIELEKFIFPCGNYTNYRNHLKTCTGNVSILTQLSIYVSDIKHLLENEIHSSDRDVINWPIYNKLISIINGYISINNKYEILTNRAIESIFNKAIICFDDEKLYQESFKILPSQRKSMNGSQASLSSAVSSSSSPVSPADFQTNITSVSTVNQNSSNISSITPSNLTASTKLDISNVPPRPLTPSILYDRHKSINISPIADSYFGRDKSPMADRLMRGQSITCDF